MESNTIKAKEDRGLLAVIGMLVATGIVMVYSSSSIYSQEHFSNQYFFIEKHLMMVVLGLVFMLIGMKIRLSALKKLSLPILSLALGLLLFLLISKHGVVKSGTASRWINLSFFSFQPSEFAKIALIIFLASYISKIGDDITSFKRGFLPCIAITGLFVVLITGQPDFGTAVTICAIVLIMLFVAGARISYLSGALLFACPPIVYLVLKSGYRLKRIIAFADPWKDPLGSGFQMIQSFIAFSNGGLTGQGLGDGKQKLLYLPEAHTDFIFSVIAEELGFIGVIAVLGLFSLFVYKGLRISYAHRDTFCVILGTGITFMIGLQAFVNMAVTMGLLPTKGLTLPFISYGGSSLVITMLAAGILVNISANVNQSREFKFAGRI